MRALARLGQAQKDLSKCTGLFDHFLVQSDSSAVSLGLLKEIIGSIQARMSEVATES